MSKYTFPTIFALALVLSAPQTQAYSKPWNQYGAGATMPAPMRPPVPEQRRPLPTETWQYHAIEKAAPYVGKTRDCAAGAFVGGLRGSPVGMGLGCVGALQPQLSPWRPLPVQ
jgi:hypothetical protein